MFYLLLVSLLLLSDAKEVQESKGIDLLPKINVCGIQNNDRIVGGVQADLDEHPWTALIKYDKPKGSSFSCGGVLISSRYVMTAAHCVKDLPQDWKLSQIRLGEWNLTSNTDCQLDDCSPDPLDVDIEEVIAHENYNSTNNQNNDIALLRLVRDVGFSVQELVQTDFWQCYYPDPLDVDIEEVIAHENYNSTNDQNNDIALLRLVRDVGFSVQELVQTDFWQCYYPDPLDVDIEEVIAHENYNSTNDQNNDIALLRLVRDVGFSDFVKPICLPTSLELKKNTFEGHNMIVSGWGKTETRSKSDVKLKLSVTVRNTQDCQKIYSRVNLQITENQLCAGGLEGQDSCRGDSGGSLMGKTQNSYSWTAVGIVSYGPSPCGTAGWPGVYTRVTSYVDWILSKIRP